MKTQALLIFVIQATVLWIALPAQAQLAPGEDPVVLQQRVSYNMLPLNNAQRSTVMSTSQEVPGWLQAKLARFQAKAFSADTTGIVTDEAVVTSTTNEGLRKVCTQEVGSNSIGPSSGRYGPKNDPQVVVLRGDLVNICR
mgnify:CR=1 FL=1|jgi:hypothetical protein